MKVEFPRQIFGKCSNIEFHYNASIGSRVVSWGERSGREQTYVTKLIVAFRSAANGSENKLVNALWGNNQCLL
jgi:hypothetical protein